MKWSHVGRRYTFKLAVHDREIYGVSTRICANLVNCECRFICLCGDQLDAHELKIYNDFASGHSTQVDASLYSMIRRRDNAQEHGIIAAHEANTNFR